LRITVFVLGRNWSIAGRLFQADCYVLKSFLGLDGLKQKIAEILGQQQVSEPDKDVCARQAAVPGIG
jgi:hypothetical protein